MITRIALGAVLGATLSTAALAQSYTAPAGIPAATAPGGLTGPAASGRGFGAPVSIGERGVTTGSVRTGRHR